MTRTERLAATLFATFLCTTFASCESNEIPNHVQNESQPAVANGHAELVSASTRQVRTVAGELKKGAEGYYIITGGRTKNRVTWHLVPGTEAADAYNALSSLIGTKVTVTGEEVSRKNNWNITIGVTAVSSQIIQ